MKILIVGGGIGGLALAAFLSDSGVDFDILEKAENFKSQGYSIGLWQNGMNMLEKMGVSEDFYHKMDKVNHYKLYNGEGKLLYNLDLGFDLAYAQVDRKILHQHILELIAPTKVIFNIKVLELEEVGDKVKVTFSTKGDALYDVVVGADGINSQIREEYFSSEAETFHNQRIWYSWIPNNFKEESTVSEYLAPGEFIGIFDAKDRAMAVMIAPKDHSIWDEENGRIKRLKKIFKNETSINSFLDEINDSDIKPSNLCHVKLKDWSKGRVVLLGDAAHGFPPNAGLGASMAMEDAYILAKFLKRLKVGQNPSRAFKQYQNLRKKRIQVASLLTDTMRLWTLTESKIFRALIDFFMPIIPKSIVISQYKSFLKKKIS